MTKKVCPGQVTTEKIKKYDLIISDHYKHFNFLFTKHYLFIYFLHVPYYFFCLPCFYFWIYNKNFIKSRKLPQQNLMENNIFYNMMVLCTT